MKKLISKIAVAARTDFVKVSVWSAASTIVRMVSGVISTKIIAWVIGPVGIGIVGNFLNSVNIFSMLGTGGIGQGVTKYIAENYDKPEKQQKIIGHAVRIALASTLLVSLFVIIFNQFYGQYIFKTSAYNTIIWLFGASIILYSFNSLFVYIINGFKAYQKFVRLNIISSIGALVISVVLVINFGLFGALLSTIVSQSAIILITIAFVCREPWFREIFSRITIDRKVIRMLGGFTLMTVVSTFMVQFAQLSVRSYIGEHLSLHDAGIWESMNRISAMYLLVITTSISTYYLPRLAEIKENPVLQREIGRTMKIVLPPLAIICTLIFLSRDIIILILFTKEFYPVRELFAFQMIGDFFKIASWLMAVLFWAKAKIRLFVFFEIVFNLSFIGLSVTGVNVFGLSGSVYGYAVNYLLLFLSLIFIVRRLLSR